MSTNKRIRGRRLQAIRDFMKQKDPLCKPCREAGVIREWDHVDHIIALDNGGKDTDSNRQGLCFEHHRLKTAADMGHTPKRTTGTDGWPED